jgi:3-oxoacyl-[acyl-carrier-protein] synthase-1
MSGSTKGGPAQDTGVSCASWNAAQGHEVCLCAISARSPLGLDAASSAAAVRAAISAIAMHDTFVDRLGKPVSLASDAVLPADLPLDARLWQLLESVLGQLTATAQLPAGQVYAWVGLPEPRAGLPEAAYAHVEQRLLAWNAPRWAGVRLLPNGHAAGLMALQGAAQQIASGAAQLCVAVATDSYHDASTLRWLDESGRLMSSSNRNGFPPGEAAAACLLASREAAQRFSLPVLATVTAAATAREPAPLGSDEVCTGLGLSAAVKAVAAGLASPSQLITATYCDLNGERHRNEEFAYTLLRTQLAFEDAHDYLCPADCWGDVGAASGLMYAALAAAAAQRGYAAGPHPVMWAGSDSGYRTAVLLSFDRAREAAAR